MMAFCAWYNPWCRSRMARQQEIKNAVEEATSTLPTTIATVVRDELKKVSDSADENKLENQI